jgi:hypothetical protein
MPQIVLMIPLGDLAGGLPGHELPGFGLGSIRPDNSLPGGGRVDPGYGRPIFHPGHPEHGLPSGGHVGNQLPWAPGHPDAGLPVPPGIDAAPVPPDLAEKVVVLWHLPGQVEWHGKVIDPSLSAGMPLPPAPEPKY